MANRNESATSTVYVDGQAAKDELQSLESSAKRLRDEMLRLGQANDKAGFDKAEKQYRMVNKQIRDLKKEAFDVQKVLKNLNGTNMNDLVKAERLMTAEMKKMERGTEAYIAKSKQLRAVKAELSKVRVEMNGVNASSKGGFFSNLSNGFNKYFGMMAAAAASFTGIVLGVRKAIDAFNEFESGVANLGALTGLAGEDLQWLSDKAKELSTSTTSSGVKITSSADVIVDAFTKMGSAQPALLKDKEALAAVTEQALILAEASKMELDDAVQGLANTMNQFGAGADEAAKYVNVLAAGAQEGAQEVPYISDAIVKFGAAAAEFNIPIEQSVALIETLGEKGLQAEVAGTGIRRFLLKLATGADETNPKVVGLEKAMENLAAKNMSAGQMMKMFGEEGYIAAQNLIAEKDRVIELTAAVTGTNVATEQAITNTSTNSAKLEQAKNRAHLMAIELGEKLAPALTFSTNAMSYMMKALKALIDFYQEHRRTIIAVSAGLAAYMVIVQGSIVLAKLQVLWNARLKKGFETLFATIKSNPYAALAAVIAGVITYLITMDRKLSDIEVRQKALKDVTDKTRVSLDQERMKIQMLVDIAKDETLSKEKRLKAIKDLNAISPKYLKGITLETINTDNARVAIDNYLASFEKKIKMEAVYSAMQEKQKRISELLANGIQDEELITKWESFQAWSTGMFSAERGKELREYFAAGHGITEFQKAQQEYDALATEYRALVSSAPDLVLPTETNVEEVDLSPGGGEGGEKANKQAEKAKKEAEDAAKKLKELQQRTKQLRRELELESMTQMGRDIALIKDKYRNELEQAGISVSLIHDLKKKGYANLNETEKAYYDNYLATVDRMEKEVADKKQEYIDKVRIAREKFDQERSEFLRDVYNMGLSDQKREVAETKDKYAKLLKQAKDFGLDTKALRIMQEMELIAIEDKYNAIRIQKDKETQDKIFAARVNTLSSTSRMIGSIMDAMGQKSEKNARYQKALGLVQIGIDTGVATASGIRAAMSDWGTSSVWEKIAATVAVVAEIVAGAASAYSLVNQANVPSYAVGGRTGAGTYTDETGFRVAGVVHQDEYVIPAWERKIPMVQSFENIIEAIRLNKYAAGGIATVPVSQQTQVVSAGGSGSDPEMKALMQAVIARMNQPLNVEYRQIKDVAQKEQQINSRFRM